jgi:hypothetical protein
MRHIMKKLLLGTAAVLTLTGAAAQAGPALDAFTALLPSDARVSFQAEGVSGDAEAYKGLEILVDGTTTLFGTAEISVASGLMSFTGNRVRISEENGAFTEADTVTFSGPIALFQTDLSTLSGAPEELGDEVCDLLSDPLLFRASGVRFDGGGQVDSLALDASTAPVKGVCALDFSQSMTGLDVTPPMGPGVRIDEQSFAGRAPVSLGLPEIAMGEVFSSEMSLKNVEVLLDGAPQVRVAEVMSRSSFDADSALPLVEAGYNRHLEALSLGLAEGRAPEEQLPYADLWNGGRALITEGGIQMSGLEIVGPAFAPLSPVPGLLDEGAKLDFNLSLSKEAELLELVFWVLGSNTALIDLSGTVRIEEADASFNALSPRALVMSAPLSFVSGSVRLSDRGIGVAAENLIGADPYMMVGPALAGLIGEANAQSLSDWLTSAKDGGEARISADPAQPVPVLMLGMMGLGDWSALGQMLNVSR